MALSRTAQLILDSLKEVSEIPGIEQYVVDGTDDRGEPNGTRWLQLCNIVNGHIDVPIEIMPVLDRLHLLLNGDLVSDRGGHSTTYYELKEAGYNLWVTERDSFGPLGAAIKCPYADWNVSYG